MVYECDGVQVRSRMRMRGEEAGNEEEQGERSFPLIARLIILSMSPWTLLGGEKHKRAVAVCEIGWLAPAHSRATPSHTRQLAESLACFLCVVMLGQIQGSPLPCRRQCPRSTSIRCTTYASYCSFTCRLFFPWLEPGQQTHASSIRKLETRSSCRARCSLQVWPFLSQLAC